MASTHFRFVSSCLVLACALLPAKARAAVVWTATFEKGDSSEWMPGTNPTKGARKNFEVLGEQVYRGKFAGKITVHPDDTFGQYNQDRVDIQHQSTLTGEGKDMWISGHYMMPADSTTRNEIAFFESNTSFQNVMDFWVDAKAGGGTTINFGVGFLGATKLWTADFSKGVWHQVAIHVLWSTNAQTGSVDVWFDGQQVVTASKAKTKADGNTLFFQTGLHRKLPTAEDDTIYFDDFIEADSMADAGIAAPSTDPAGGSGGSGGAGGAAGAGGGSTGGVGGSSSPIGGTGGAAQSGAGMGGTGGSAGSSNIAGVYTSDGGPNNIGGSVTSPVPATSNDSSGCSLGAVDKTDGTVSLLLGLLGLAALRGARRRR